MARSIFRIASALIAALHHQDRATAQPIRCESAKSPPKELNTEIRPVPFCHSLQLVCKIRWVNFNHGEGLSLTMQTQKRHTKDVKGVGVVGMHARSHAFPCKCSRHEACMGGGNAPTSFFTCSKSAGNISFNCSGEAGTLWTYSTEEATF